MQIPPDPLDAHLDRWRDAPPPLPGPVGPEVWRRLAEARARRRPGILARLIEDFGRPAPAAAFVAACILLGLFLAEVRLSRLRAERDRQMAQSYLKLIDPLMASEAAAAPPARPPS